ncbi:glycoside hydrolase [Dacryopinax primogenitus]|uniref:Glycoside hydrolase n=1 Tax=Dacryopinax primogenitus (strain DJM 731) TaxID=1858805 RepID=M5GGA6_DACPD|nr:glycoside hydrolase [Dacryopinax primogenitus]EJU05153.1 glycoside hydrolase [Dacryopinax primogenitus]
MTILPLALLFLLPLAFAQRTTSNPLAATSTSPAGAAASATALNEPPDGQLYFGLWLDTSVTSGDSPLAANARVGRNISWFQFSQNIPVDQYNDVTGVGGIINATKVTETDTDAGIYVTVYPLNGLAAVTVQDMAALGIQLQSYIAAGHAVCLRFAPEMNGNWFPYATQPTLFKSTWITLYNTVKQSCPSCAFVWSPNAAVGYPYGITLDSVASAADQAALDTNNDGQLDNTDDAYAAYYPGDAYVDWNGVSYYYKGNYPNDYNVIQPQGFFEGSMNGVLPEVDEIGQQRTQYTPFYNAYCMKHPCMLSESGASWKVNQTGIPDWLTVSPTQEQVEGAWWRDGITNITFLSTYPRLKMIMNFEWEKVETDGGIPTLRDFRLTNATDVLAAFVADLEGVAQRYLWASYVAPPPSGSGGGGGSNPLPQVPMPQASVTRATPYRATTPTVLSLFYSAAQGWEEMRPYVFTVAAVTAGLAAGVGLVL